MSGREQGLGNGAGKRARPGQTLKAKVRVWLWLQRRWRGMRQFWAGEWHYLNLIFKGSSIQFTSVQSLSHVRLLWPHGLQHTRLPCPSPIPGPYPNLCPLSQWYHPTISSSVIPFSFCLQSFPASRSFPLSQFFALGGQSIGVSASASVLLMNIQNWFPLGWTGLISLLSKGLSKVFSNTQFKNISSLALSFLYGPTLTSIHNYWKNHSFD